MLKQHFKEDKFKELRLHWESTVWFLEKRLTDLSKLQKDMQEKRLQQQEAQKKLRLTYVKSLIVHLSNWQNGGSREVAFDCN